MTDYRPVGCEQHSLYELAIMQRRRLRLAWQDARQASLVGTVSPLDLYTSAGAEFLRVIDAQERIHDIRLDRIMRCELLPSGQD